MFSINRRNFYGALLSIITALLYLLAAGVTRPAWAGDDGRGADLRVAGILDINPPLPGPDEETEIGVWVENRGDEDAFDVPIYFYVDGRSFDREVVDIKAGDSVDIRVTWIADGGDHYLTVVVDPGGEYNDNKGDNTTGTWVTVR